MLAIGILLMLHACGCKNNDQGTALIPTHLTLSSNTVQLKDTQTTFQIFIKNEAETAPKLGEYNLLVSLQEIGGTGSTLKYTDATNTSKTESAIQQPLSHFIQQGELKKGDSLISIPWELKPSSGVTKVTITIQLQHQGNKDTVSPLTIHWKLSPITDAMIQLAADNFTDLKDVLEQLQAGEVLDMKQVPTRSILWEQAMTLGNVDVLNALLARGLDINEDFRGLNSLGLALEKDNNAIATLLIGNLSPAQLNQPTENGVTPLSYAVSKNNETIAKELLKKIAPDQVQEKDNQDNTILYWAIEHNEALALSLIERSTDAQLVHRPYGIFPTPLEHAISMGKEAIALKLIEKLSVEELNKPGPIYNGIGKLTILHYASKLGKLDIVQALIGKGVNKNVTDAEGKSPLDLATDQNVKAALTVH